MNINILVWSRAIERILVCLFGGIALYLGSNLFRMGIQTFQTAEFASQKWTLKLERVGPGVFFALFGAAILVWSIISPLSIPATWLSSPTAPSGKTVATPTAQGNLSYAGQMDEGAKRRLIVAINTVDRICGENAEPVVSKEKLRALTEAKNELRLLRDSWMTDQFGAEMMKIYKDKIDIYLQSPDTLTRADRDVIEKLEPWMETTLLSGTSRRNK